MKKKITIKEFDNRIEKPTYIDGKSDWIDLRARERIVLKKGDFALVPLNVAMEIPKGYEAHLVPRSSTFKNYGVIQTNGIGVIDNSYCGNKDEWKMPVYCLEPRHKDEKGKKVTIIEAGERIAQFRIVKNQPRIKFNFVKVLFGKNRDGFGSTGVK